jgi:cytidine deaminase
LTPEAQSVTPESLVAEARRALANAHAPYSRFPVGAALLGESGRVYLAVNVENASYGLSVCAERCAVFAAIAAGEKRFKALAVVTDTADPTPPCGACRQVLREFVADLPVHLAGRAPGAIVTRRLSELLPHAFSSPSEGRDRGFTA